MNDTRSPKRDVRLYIRISSEEKEQMMADARSLDMSLSNLLLLSYEKTKQISSLRSKTTSNKVEKIRSEIELLDKQFRELKIFFGETYLSFSDKFEDGFVEEFQQILIHFGSMLSSTKSLLNDKYFKQDDR